MSIKLKLQTRKLHRYPAYNNHKTTKTQQLFVNNRAGSQIPSKTKKNSKSMQHQCYTRNQWQSTIQHNINCFAHEYMIISIIDRSLSGHCPPTLPVIDYCWPVNAHRWPINDRLSSSLIEWRVIARWPGIDWSVIAP